MAETTQKSVLLVIVDPQNDFHEGGSLAVAGATKDSERLAAWIKAQGAKITDIVVTMDSHQKYHCGHPNYWIDAKTGAKPDPFTLIKTADLASNGGKWQTFHESQRKAGDAYVKALEDSGKFILCIWPEHCIVGTPGWNVQPTLMEALNWWADTTKKPIDYLIKGVNPDTEMYSALRAEVPNKDPSTELNKAAVAKWNSYDTVVFCGEAKSHCVNFTCTDFVTTANAGGKTVLLSDCQSSVGGFEKQGEAFFKSMQEQGVKLVATTDYNL